MSKRSVRKDDEEYSDEDYSDDGERSDEDYSDDGERSDEDYSEDEDYSDEDYSDDGERSDEDYSDEERSDEDYSDDEERSDEERSDEKRSDDEEEKKEEDKPPFYIYVLVTEEITCEKINEKTNRLVDSTESYFECIYYLGFYDEDVDNVERNFTFFEKRQRKVKYKKVKAKGEIVEKLTIGTIDAKLGVDPNYDDSKTIKYFKDEVKPYVDDEATHYILDLRLRDSKMIDVDTGKVFLYKEKENKDEELRNRLGRIALKTLKKFQRYIRENLANLSNYPKKEAKKTDYLRYHKHTVYVDYDYDIHKEDDFGNRMYKLEHAINKGGGKSRKVTKRSRKVTKRSRKVTKRKSRK